jgi:alkanesulfonate monooxygenase
VVCCGSDQGEIARRAAAIGRDVDELREHGLCGTPDEVLAKLAEYAAVGASRVYLQVLDLHDLDHLALLGRDVLPGTATL